MIVIDAGRGPTRSSWMWLKRREVTGMCCGGTSTWHWTLARWQPKQAFAQAVTSVERPFQTYLEEIRRLVTRLPGWAVLWRCSKTCRQRSLGTSGRNVPVDKSPLRSRSSTFCLMMRRLVGWSGELVPVGKGSGGGPYPSDLGVLCR
jgi:hypothetical protein